MPETILSRASQRSATPTNSLTIKAIPTKWRGRHFRSRLEARYAVLFDALDLKYQYEPEAFQLDGTRYLPDFYLPEIKFYAEVKPNAGAIGKGYQFVAETGLPILRLDGEPGFRSYTGFWNPETVGEPINNEFSLDIWMYRKIFEKESRLYCEPDYSAIFLNIERPEDAFSIRYRAGVEAALSARFGS